MIKPEKLNFGDTIGVVAPSNPIIGENIEEINLAKRKIEDLGFNVKFSKNLFLNTNMYSATPQEKAEDINLMFADKNIKMIWCAKGGANSNSVFDFLDYKLIKENPKIICGYSDITSITNVINLKTGLVTFSGTNFKTVATDKTDYSLKQVLNRFVYEDLQLGLEDDKFEVINNGISEGELVGGNLSLIRGLVGGKYSINFKNKILFIEELGYESEPTMVSNNLYYMKQNGVFENLKGIWIGNYEHESGIKLEDIVIHTLGKNCGYPIIKSNNFGHIETKTVIPIGINAKIDTTNKIKITLLEKCLKK